jgi:hypothetical protein
MSLIPLMTVINFMLFILAVYFLKRTIKPFINSDFYSSIIVSNLKKAGSLFLFIGVSTILICLISALYLQNMTQHMVLGKSSWWFSLVSIVSSIDLTYVFLIIIGLFLLLFSNTFNNARTLKQENDLTI